MAKEKVRPQIQEKFKSLRFSRWDPQQESERVIIKQMVEFAHHPDARTVPQFLALKEIGYETLKYWTTKSYKLKNAYQAMLSILWCKWFDFAMDSKKLPSHQAKILEKYLNLYDEHLFDAMTTNAKEIASAQASSRNYTSENYQTIGLTKPYKKLYEENDGKRTHTPGDDDGSGRDNASQPVSSEGVPKASPEGT